jgi:alginate production protein
VPTCDAGLVARHAALIVAVASLLPGTTVAAAAPREDQRVEVKGRLRSDAWIEARRLRLRDADRGSKIEGAVLRIDRTQRRLRIAGFTVVLDEVALVERADTSPGRLEDLQVGQIVEAKGMWTGRQLEASRLRIRAPRAPGETAADELEIEADIEWTDTPHHIQLLGHPVGLPRDGKLSDERTVARLRGAPTTMQTSADRLRRDVDDQQVQPIRVGEWLTLGGRIGGDMWNQQELVTGSDDARDREDHVNAVAQLLASARLGKHVELYTKVGASRAFVLQHLDAAEQPALRLYEGYLALGPQAPAGLQVGRQRFRDGREWFYDDYLDAVRLHVQWGTWRAETAIAEAVFDGPNELRGRAGQRHTILSLTKRFGGRTDAAAFLIARDDRNRRERPMWIGGEWNGRVTSNVKSWALGAVRRGESESGRLGGWAMDAGLAGRLPLRGAPSLAAGYATATGETSGSDGVDRRFRQTGLDDNTARFFGVKRFAQYGEVLNPELSNLTVLTFGAGVRPLARTSLDLVYHRYYQRELRRSLPSNRLDAVGTGQSTTLGDELDLIVAVQEWRRVSLSMVLGVFRPGEGVTSPVRPVMYWKPEFRFFF